MEYYLILVAVLIVFCSILILQGKSPCEKSLAFNQLSSLVALFIVLLSTYEYYKTYVDIAIIYSLFSFVATMALLHFGNKKTDEV